MLTERGYLGNQEINDAKLRDARQEKQKAAYHNTLMLLKQYRNIAWMLECFPDTIAEELEQPFTNLDELIDRVDVEMAMDNRKLEGRMESIRKSRLLMDRVNEALTVLRKKPGNGEKMYKLIHLAYIAPEQLTLNEKLFRLNLSSRQYYRLHDQAVQHSVSSALGGTLKRAGFLAGASDSAGKPPLIYWAYLLPEKRQEKGKWVRLTWDWKPAILISSQNGIGQE